MRNPMECIKMHENMVLAATLAMFHVVA